MATHMMPHSASHTPTRPVSSYSAHSTIRRVTPSPESLSEALAQGFATHSTPRRPHAQSSKDLGYGQASDIGNKTHEEQEGLSSQHYSIKPSREPLNNPRKITPSRIPVPSKPTTGRLDNIGGLKRRKAARLSPHKLEANRQQRATDSLQTRPVIAAPNSQAASARLALPMEPTKAPPAVPDEERARLAEFTLFPTDDPFITPAPTLPPASTDPAHPAVHRSRPSDDAFQSPLQKHDDPDALAPLPDSPRKPIPQLWMKPGSHAHPTHRSRDSDPDAITPVTPVAARGSRSPRDPSVKSWASHMTFSTPGRDEMERKRACVKGGDEGPFGAAKSMYELTRKRRQVSEGKIVQERVGEVGQDGEKKKKKKKEKGKKNAEDKSGGLCKCCVM